MTPTTLEVAALRQVQVYAYELAGKIATLPTEQQASVLATLFEALAEAGVNLEMVGCVLEEAQR